MNTMFVAHANDSLGQKAISVLEGRGYYVQLLEDGQKAPRISVAIFSSEPSKDCNWPSRYLRMSAHRLQSLAPEWASETPFLVGVRNQHQENQRRESEFKKAVLNMARNYTVWYPGQAGVKAPWHPDERNLSPGHRDDFDAWLQRAKVAMQGKVSLKEAISPRLTSLFGD